MSGRKQQVPAKLARLKQRFVTWRKTTAVVYDGQGFWLCQNRLSKGRFH